MANVGANLMVINLDISLLTFWHLPALPADPYVDYATNEMYDANCLKSILLFYHCISTKRYKKAFPRRMLTNLEIALKTIKTGLKFIMDLIFSYGMFECPIRI